MNNSISHIVRRPLAVLALLSVLGLGACEVNRESGTRTLTGAAVGAGAGAVTGLLTGNFLGKTATGAAAGAAGGFIYDQIQKH